MALQTFQNSFNETAPLAKSWLELRERATAFRRKPPFTPSGYEVLFDAIENAGRALHPSTWTGEERSISPEKSAEVLEIMRGPGKTTRRDIPVNFWPFVASLPIELESARCDAELNAFVVGSLFPILQARVDQIVRDAMDKEKERRLKAERATKAGSSIGGGPTTHMASRPKEEAREQRICISSWCRDMLSRLPKAEDAERAKNDVTARRQRVENAARNALYSGKVTAAFFDQDGEIRDIPKQLWATPAGQAAIEGSPQGVLMYSAHSNVAVILKSGELTKILTGSKPIENPEVSADRPSTSAEPVPPIAAKQNEPETNAGSMTEAQPEPERDPNDTVGGRIQAVLTVARHLRSVISPEPTRELVKIMKDHPDGEKLSYSPSVWEKIIDGRYKQQVERGIPGLPKTGG